MPAVYSTISQADYNDIRNKVIGILGTGTADSGYGQTLRSSAIATGNRVTINEWGNLRYDIINAYTHIFGSAPTTAQVYEGGTVRYTSSFTPDTGSADVPEYQYNVYADQLIANKFTVHSSQSAINVPSSPATYTATWNTSISCTIDIYWSTAEQARFFFNSGGQIRITSSRSGGSATNQNSSWTSLLSTAGTQQFGGNNPATGTTPNDGRNWFRLNNTYQNYYTISASSPYGSNQYSLAARTADVTSNSSGTSRSMQIRATWNDGHVGISGGPDSVDGTFQISVSLLYATGVMVPTGTPNFAVSLPTVSIGGIG